MNKILQKGFTLVELLIVIALIAILSVAVLSTINPIEQANKARDSRVQNDAAEVLNAMERYYASKQIYPWVEFAGGTPITSGQAITLRSDSYGFGVCSEATDAPDLLSKEAIDRPGARCDTGPYTNYLIQTSELKSSFMGKDSFEPVRSDAKPEQAMWVAKGLNADSIYLCYVPKAKANRDDLDKLRCVNNVGAVSRIGTGTCAAPAADGSDWAVDPATLGPGGGDEAGLAAPIAAVFKCVPE
jgi:prepilin-type N-terminal cleavage/methylation domain-containing protein